MIDINKYISAEKNSVTYGLIKYNANGYYEMHPMMLKEILMKELGFQGTYDELKDCVQNSKIKLSEETIKKYLKEKQKKEEPDLLTQYDKVKPKTINLLEWQDEPDLKFIKAMELERKIAKYAYDPYTYKYYQRYIILLKNKCVKFFELIDLLVTKSLHKTYNEKTTQLMLEFDIVLNENYKISSIDLFRIVEPFIYNINELRKYLKIANDLETYFKEKKSSELNETLKDGNPESSLYPTDNLQVKDAYYIDLAGYIPLTKKQKEQIKKEKEDAFNSWLDDINKDEIRIRK